jgi:IS605 OrfB family transposase
VNIANTREYRKVVKRLREKNKKVGRVRHVASELTKTPGIIVTEELGDTPQEEMIADIEKSELRHRIKQTPFKAVEEAVEDKALERGSKIFRASSYRNSRVCPIHFTRLEGTDNWHILKCPLGHIVDRDYASVVNMMWKTTPEAWSKGVWWDLRKRMDWGEYEGESNPLVPHPIVQYLWYVLMIFMASEESPAVLARGTPMNPAREAYESWARKPPRSKGTPAL